MRARALRAMAAAFLFSACAAATPPSGASRDHREVLTQQQLAATNSADVYAALELLRPEWLTTRGPSSLTNATPAAPSVFMNGQLLGRVEALREMRVMDVSQVRFWPTGPAAAKFGMGHPRGVIEITRN